MAGALEVRSARNTDAGCSCKQPKSQPKWAQCLHLRFVSDFFKSKYIILVRAVILTFGKINRQMQINPERRLLTFEIDGRSAGNPISIALPAEQIAALRPAVQLKFKGDIVEIL